MDSLLLPSQSTWLASSHRSMHTKSSGSVQDRGRVSLSSSYSRVHTKLLASFKIADQQHLPAVKEMKCLAARATVATDEGGVNEAKLDTEDDGLNETELASGVDAVTEAEVAPEEVEDLSPTSSGSDSAVAKSIELLKTAARTKKVPGSEINAAFKILGEAKLDPKEFLSFIGGTKSPGRTWLLIFTSSVKDNGPSGGGGKYFPITAVQNFDSEAKTIENGVYLGPLGTLTFSGDFLWENRKLSFIFHKLNLKIGPLGPFSFGIGSKDKGITNADPFFLWYYADDEIIVGNGRGGGTAFWVRCARVNKY